MIYAMVFAKNIWILKGKFFLKDVIIFQCKTYTPYDHRGALGHTSVKQMEKHTLDLFTADFSEALKLFYLIKLSSMTYQESGLCQRENPFKAMNHC